MPKRKADVSTSSNDHLNQDKKVRQENEQQQENPSPTLGKLYCIGKDEHVLITGIKQRLNVQGVEVETQVQADGGLKLVHYEHVSDMDEKHQEVAAHVQNQIDHRELELKDQKQIRADINARIESEDDDIIDQELEQLLAQKNGIDRIIRLHVSQLKKLHAKTSVGVHYQVHTSGLSCVLAVGKLLETSFLPKPVCWVPHGVSLDVPCEAVPAFTEDKFQELPFPCGLGEADVEWFKKHRKTLSDEEMKAKVAGFKSSAESGNAYGQYLFGECYYYGHGVTKDRNRAAELFTLSADQKNSWGLDSLGYCFKHGYGVAMDKKRAAELHTLSADQGNAHGQNCLGTCYYNGDGVTKDRKRAAELYILSAEQGNAHGQCNLGTCFKHGHGVVQDRKRAVELFKLSAEQGNVTAQNKLEELL